MSAIALKEEFSEIVFNTVMAEIYNIKVCGVAKTKMEMFDLDTLYLKIKALETCK